MLMYNNKFREKTLRKYHRYMSRDLLLMAWELDDIRLFQSSVQCHHLAKRYISSRTCLDVFRKILSKSINDLSHTQVYKSQVYIQQPFL